MIFNCTFWGSKRSAFPTVAIPVINFRQLFHFPVIARLFTEGIIIYLTLVIGWLTLFDIDEGNGGTLDTAVLFLCAFLLLRAITLAVWNIWKFIRRTRLTKEAVHTTHSIVLFKLFLHIVSEISVLALALFMSWVAMNYFKDGYAGLPLIILFGMSIILILRVVFFAFFTWRKRHIAFSKLI